MTETWQRKMAEAGHSEAEVQRFVAAGWDDSDAAYALTMRNIEEAGGDPMVAFPLEDDGRYD